MFELQSGRSIIEIRGDLPANFLQKLISNDIVENKYCYTYMLNNQGRYLFDFFVHNLDSRTVLIDIASGPATELISKLNFYKLRTNVTITTNNDYNIIYSKKELSKNAICSYRDPRFNLLGFRSVVEKGAYHPDDNTEGLYLHDKYEHTIPDGDIDLIAGKSIPVEYGAEELHSIDYNKGCYVGQEVISRTKYQGVVRKKIYKIISEDSLNLKENMTEVKSGDRVLGTTCSYYKNLGIALIREENFENVQNDPITIANFPVKLIIPQWRQI